MRHIDIFPLPVANDVHLLDMRFELEIIISVAESQVRPTEFEEANRRFPIP